MKLVLQVRSILRGCSSERAGGQAAGGTGARQSQETAIYELGPKSDGDVTADRACDL